MTQILFCSEEMIHLGRRFASGFMIGMDATFRTNIKIPLVLVVGMTNTGKTFPVTFSFVRSEHSDDFEFIIQWLEKLVWNDCSLPSIL
jgi:hypothetical protein